MRTKRIINRVQPLLYIDNPEHSLPSQGDNELEVLYKRRNQELFEEAEQAVEQEAATQEKAETPKETPMQKKRSFDLSRHLGFDWQQTNNSMEANEFLRDALSDKVSTEKTVVSERKEEKPVQKKDKKPFSEKTVNEKVDLLYKMRNLQPTVCTCKTSQETWVGNVTAVEDEQFTMQTQQLPYLVTIKYEDVVDLTIETFA
ncbi:CotO family spore coat protein [Geomicrobium sp. JCM 19039]|uniref:CotO family spore coat protein n=1 Tax=Geomicrobium sp. JCM 19039 TaxID=1460636 RepID=UPI00045F19F8|nr:CotO family spore coat protein [Geomicrobium sp. JCM 19039]GAK11882.1 hypothetical protein JCM19039_1604 [Geomicrobium sp. JCM 19039]